MGEGVLNMNPIVRDVMVAIIIVVAEEIIRKIQRR
jgi:hypothetical protein